MRPRTLFPLPKRETCEDCVNCKVVRQKHTGELLVWCGHSVSQKKQGVLLSDFLRENNAFDCYHYKENE